MTSIPWQYMTSIPWLVTTKLYVYDISNLTIFSSYETHCNYMAYVTGTLLIPIPYNNDDHQPTFMSIPYNTTIMWYQPTKYK